MAFDLNESIERARDRLRDSRSSRFRSDRGQSRLDPVMLAELERLLSGQDRPTVRSVLDDLALFGTRKGLDVPARSTVYEAMGRTAPRSYEIAALPPWVRATLYNLSEDGVVPGHQLAFHCLNYGDLRAVSFAAGLPWLALHQAARLTGWRRRSRGLLEAILKVRRI